MDLSQNKLSKSEWENIEIPVSESEKKIIQMITKGFDNINIRDNDSQSLFMHIKMDKTLEIEYFLYKKYFEEEIQYILKKYAKNISEVSSFAIMKPVSGELRTLKSADSIRLQNLDNNIKINKPNILEFLFLDLCKDMLKHIMKRKQRFAFYLYTLIQLKKTSVPHMNQYVMNFVECIIQYGNSITKTSEIITNAYDFIERNTYLLKYEDKCLFNHQKELFTICKKEKKNEIQTFHPKLILYTAPTGTGKTLSPLGLSEGYRIIFVCVARHIGLALAKAAISIEKKVAFAFGCETASDIRLHYFSAVNYTKHRKSGGIWKVDNSVGTNVEIMICDVQSYLTAMYYMLAFNPAENIITYWDEPTITMDYEEHPLHSVIRRNWVENKIPTIVLSCATLPANEDIQPVFDDFRDKFDNSEIYTIKSFDCRKSIPILNREGYCVLPHFIHEKYEDLYKCAEYCKENKTLLRYFDLREIIYFIEHVNEHSVLSDNAYSIDEYFGGIISDITMNSLKQYYLEVIMHIQPDNWEAIHKHMMVVRKKKYGSNTMQKTSNYLSRTRSVDTVAILNKLPPSSGGILLTTADAYTLTDGPTIFLAEDINKIGNFYIQQSNIAATVFQNIMSNIMKNSEIIEKIEKLEKLIEQKEAKSCAPGEDKDPKALARESGRLCNESRAWTEEINKLRKEIRLVSLDPIYVPNTRPHQQIWGPHGEINDSSFVSNIGEEVTKSIMQLNIDHHYKVLLLLGIGMFTNINNKEYMEIMKKLADEQRLFIIIASTDYIYGTNYQFCHGFIGKDLTNMTQQKTLQAMGRIGRNNVQQDYTIRFRDDTMIEQLFKKSENNLEAKNMCNLFSR